MQFIKKLDYYLGPENEYADFNIGMYDELYQQQDISELFQPVDFFEKAYAEFLFFYHHSANYLDIVNHFKSLPYNEKQTFYILYYVGSLLPIEYADKETRGLTFRHDDIVFRGIAYVQNLFNQYNLKLEQQNRNVPTDRTDRIAWQFPAWNKQDFIDNQSAYRHDLTTYGYSEDDFIYSQRPYYNIKKGKLICARLTPLEYFGVLIYDIAIPKAREITDLHQRLERLRKIRSDVQTHRVDLITTNEIGKEYKAFFDFSEIVQHIDVYIENVESSLKLKAFDMPNAPETAQFDFNDEIIALKAADNAFWKGLPMPVVVDHFMIFVNKTSKNGSPYLSKEELVSFLKKGFLKNSAEPKQKINYGVGEKGLVIKRFYELFAIAASKYGHPNRKQSFIKLITECFDNWNDNAVSTFFKPNKVKEEW